MAPLKLDGKTVIERCYVAKGFGTRFLGLMGRSGLDVNEALFFPKCNSIHTFFMRFPIDVVFTDRTGCVVEVIESLPAWRMLLPRLRASHVLELAPGQAKVIGLKTGCHLQLEGELS